MVGSSKILTVSYGTFSCTLEGFEDSFSTMKAIAEYFRDLAADDRYFGAEPPTPDAEMLARIAEREVSRRVEARSDSRGIVLSALAPAAAAPMAERAAPEPAAAPAPQDLPPPADAGEAVRTEPSAGATAGESSSPLLAAAAPAAAPAPTATAPAMPPLADDDSVAAKLRRIRAVVGRTATPAAPVAAEDGGEDAPMVGFASTDEEDGFPEADFSAPDSDWARTVADVPAIDDMPAAADTLDEATEDDVATTAAVEDEIQGWDADLSNDAAHEDVDADAAVDVEDETADDTSGLVDLSAYVAGTYDASEAEAGELDVVEASDDAASDSVGETAADADLDRADDDEDDDLLALDADDDEPAPTRARVIRMSRSDFEAAIARTRTPDAGTEDENAFAGAALADDEADGVADEAAFADPAIDPDHLADDADAAGTLSDEDEAELMSELAALEAEDDLDEADAAAFWDEAVLTEDDLARAEGAQAEETPRTAAADPGTDDDDADETDHILAAALAAAEEDEDDLEEPAVARRDEDEADASDDVEIEEDAPVAEEDEATEAEDGSFEAPVEDRADLDDEEPVGDADEPPAAESHGTPVRMLLAQEREDEEASLARLMTRAEGELSAPEAQSRREALTGLKAAVAAAEADRQLGDGKRHTDEAAFRDDLRQVVRPRRPEAGAEHRSERPRPAPLKLVAAQRIDLPQQDAAPRPAQPVRPRRVTLEDALDTAPAAGASKPDAGFAQFAAEMGAHDLPDLLEAAAAYTSFVEKAPDFSRPQLVNKVREMASGEFSREDELRSFGTLLRQGRIAKVRNGRFAVTEATRFHPERAAG